jgi:hypothetical protein
MHLLCSLPSINSENEGAGISRPIKAVVLCMLSVVTLTASAEGSGHDRAGSSAAGAGQLLVLCDGAGGLGGAAEAAEAVCNHFCRLDPPPTSVRANPSGCSGRCACREGSGYVRAGST